MRTLAGALWCTAVAAQVALPTATSEAKVLRGRIVTAEAAEGGGWVTVRDLSGRLLRKVQAGAGVEGIRAAEIKDFTLDAERTLVVSLGVAFPMGQSARLVAFYPEKGAARFLGSDDVVCKMVAADEATGVWCFGRGLEETWLHRMSGPAAGPWSLMGRKKLRVLANDGGETRQADESGQMGVPRMMAAGPGRLAVYLPNTLAVQVVDTRTGGWAAREVAVEPAGRSNLSFAAEGEELWGLMPEPGEVEGFRTRYWLWRWAGRWEKVAGAGWWPRGAALAGAEGGKVYVWNRTDGRLEAVAAPAVKRAPQ